MNGHHNDAERALLGALLWPAGQGVLDRLRPEVFTVNGNRTIAAALVAMRDRGQPIDVVTVSRELSGKVDPLVVESLAADVPVPENAGGYLTMVQEAYEARKLASIAEAAREAALHGDIESARAKLTDLAMSRVDADTESSWEAVDLDPILLGHVIDQRPMILQRTDERALLYPGRVHNLAGEPEAGKGWLALRACAGRMALEEPVAYIDFEDTAETAVERLRALATPDDMIAERFRYVRPEEPVNADLRELAAGCSLVVVDGITEAMTLHGLKIESNTDVAILWRQLVRPLSETGAAVLLIDHVTKNREQRGRWALGAQHKMAAADVTYGLEVIQPFGRGLSGLSRLELFKDRPGHVRGLTAGGRLIGEVHFTSKPDGLVTVTIEPPQGAEAFRPTFLMERVSRFLELQPEGASIKAIREGVAGKTEAKLTALTILVAEGFVGVEDGPRGARLHRVLKPFRNEGKERSVDLSPRLVPSRLSESPGIPS